jgi:quinoprotein glucose dehydrogenase
LLYWPGEGTHGPRLLFNAGDHLHALDPASGRPLPEFGDGGKVATGPVVVAGAVFKHVLVIPGFHRDVYGYDVRTGTKLWHFNTISSPGESGAETWDKPGSGANCWGGMALDEHRGVAYIATGSPKPNFIGIHHRGDNLYANCVLALDALTGGYIWHFQEIRHDIWDLDIPAAPNLVTVRRDGIAVDAVAQVTKLGNTLLLDRMTGEPLFDVVLRRAPASKLPGERTADYQPDIRLPEPFARQVFSPKDVTDRTPEAREYVEAQIQRANFGWFEPFEDGVPTVFYGIHGGAEWTGAAVDPNHGILYVSSNELPWIITVHRTDDIPRPPGMPLTRGEVVYREACATCHGLNREGVGVSPPLQGLRHRMTDEVLSALLDEGRNLMPAAPPMSSEDRMALMDHVFLRDRPNPDPDGVAPPVYTSDGYRKLLDHEGYPGSRPPWGTLNAIDLNSGKRLWQVPLGEHPELTADGLPITGTENFGGPIVTAGGLVFCAGTRDEKIRAFDSETGEELWSWKLPWGGYAPPATFEVDGRQYLVIAATGGGKLGGRMGDAYVAFHLGDGRTVEE